MICSATGAAAAAPLDLLDPPLGLLGLLRAQMREAGPPWSSTLNTPTSQWYQGGAEKPQVMELPTPVSINASCMTVDGGSVTVDGPGMLYTSRDNGSTWDAGTTTEYYQTVDVAFGMRPFINEENGTLLLLADKALVAQLQQATAAEQAAVYVTLRLPFATTTAAKTVTWRGDKLLQRAETVLSFPLASLPATVNQDAVIEISLPHSHTITKMKRLMRAPPLPAGSFVQAVQVDHSTRSLSVDGRPFNGIGWYMDGLDVFGDFSPGYVGYKDLPAYAVHRLVPAGVNQGMIYRLFDFPAARQLAVLDELAAGGFKVRSTTLKIFRACPGLEPHRAVILDCADRFHPSNPPT